MKEPLDSPGPKKQTAKTGLTLFMLVGGFILLIMIIGWLTIAARG